jgi:hypothetical protein
MIRLKEYWHIYASLAIVILTGVILAWLFRNQINPDGVSYIQAARHYAAFDLSVAINGYWAPLLSWLLVPFVWLRVDPLFAFRLINLIVPIVIICSLLFYLNKSQSLSHVERYMQFAFITSFGILLNIWGSSVVTPDLLSGAILLLVIVLLYRYLQTNSLRYAILLGVSLALLYLTKSIGLYVSVALVAALLSYEFFRNKRVAKNSYVVLCVFGIMSLTWIGLISVKYQTLTISTAGSYNFALYGPEHPSHPQTTQGYLPVQHPTDVWGWDDPSYFTIPSWKVTDNIPYYFNYVLKNANLAFAFLFMSTPLIIFGLFALFNRKKERNLTITGYALALSSLLIIGAYSLIYVEARYLWFITIPIVAFGATLLHQRVKNILPISILLSLILVSSLLSLVPHIQDGYERQVIEAGNKSLAKQADQQLPDYAQVAGYEAWQFCYFSNTQCVGNYLLNGHPAHDKSLIAKMKQKGVRYYVDFANENFPYLKNVYKGVTPIKTCFDYKTGKNKECQRAILAVYRL